MITIQTVVALAIRERVVMDALGEALRSDLVNAHPILRQIVEFADDFLTRFGKLPSVADWGVWVEGLNPKIGDGVNESLQRLHATNVSAYQPEFFAEQILPILRQIATQNAVSRLQSVTDPTPEMLATVTERVGEIGLRSVAGLAKLSEVNVWINAGGREEDLIPTGFPKLDAAIGGWGKELWLLFADAKAGKSMLLQNWGSAAAMRGKRVLHVSLELGLASQIQRYYRQIAQAERGEFVRNQPQVKRNLEHWFRMAKGEVYLVELPAYSTTPDDLRRMISRISRTIGNDIDLLVLDYLDLLVTTKGGRSRYEDLGKLTHEVRAFCPTFGIPVLSATQAVRRPEKQGRLTHRDIGDSYEKVRGADGILGLVQTEEEAKMHQARLTVVLARDSASSAEIPLYVNRDLSLIAPEDNPNIERLRRQLGHHPEVRQQVAAATQRLTAMPPHP